MDEKELDELTEDQYDALMYAKAYVKNAWILVGFCIVGWGVFYSGLLEDNFLYLLLGTGLFGAPIIWVWWNDGFRGMFGEVTVEHSYQDNEGRVRTRSDSNASLAVNLLMAFIFLVLSVFLVMLRYVSLLIRYWLKTTKIPSEYRLDFKHGILLPTLVGVIGFIAVSNIVGYILKGIVAF